MKKLNEHTECYKKSSCQLIQQHMKCYIRIQHENALCNNKMIIIFCFLCINAALSLSKICSNAASILNFPLGFHLENHQAGLSLPEFWDPAVTNYLQIRLPCMAQHIESVIYVTKGTSTTRNPKVTIKVNLLLTCASKWPS